MLKLKLEGGRGVEKVLGGALKALSTVLLQNPPQVLTGRPQESGA